MRADLQADRIHARRWWILGVLCVELALIGIDVTILTVAIPEFVTELNADGSDIQWIIGAYSLTFAGFVVTLGSVSDRFGRKRVLLIGLVAFAMFSGVAAFSTSPEQLILFRALTGIAAAMIMPATLSIIANVFDDKERARAIGIWSGVAGLGFIFGPILGGVLLTHFWWGSVLLVNVPVVAVALVLTIWLVPESKDPRGHPIDLGGTILSVVGLVALVYAVIQGPEAGWGSVEVVVSFTIAAVAIGLFVWWELRVEHPMLDVRLFRVPSFAVPALVIALTMFVIFGLTLLLPQYLQFVEGESPLSVGLLIAPLAVTWSAAAIGVPLVAERIGTKPTIVGALVIVMIGLAAFLLLGGAGAIAILIAASCIVGIGMGASETPATVLLLHSVPPEKAGVGSAMNDLTREAGGAVGIAVLGSITAGVYTAAVSSDLVKLSEPEAEAVRGGIGGAVDVATQTGNAQLLATAQDAFVSGYKVAMIAGLVVIAALLVIVIVWLPRRAATTY